MRFIGPAIEGGVILAAKDRAGVFKSVARFTRARETLRAWVLLGPTVLWVALFLAIPIALVVVFGFASLDPAHGYTFNPMTTEWYREALNPGGILFSLATLTLAIAAASTALALVLGYAVAYFIARLAPEKWRGVLMALVVIPFWVSFLVRVYGILAFVGDDSVLYPILRPVGLGWFLDGLGPLPGFKDVFRFGSPQIVIFTLVYVWLPFMVLPLFTSLSKLDPQLLEAALDLGASRTKAFLHVTLPLTIPGVITGSILVFITSVGSFVEPKLMGGNSLLMVGNFIEDTYESAFGFPRMAAASISVIAFTLLFVGVYTRYAHVELGAPSKEGFIEKFIGRIKRAARAPVIPSSSHRIARDGGSAVVHQAYATAAVPRNVLELALDFLVERTGKWALGIVTILTIVSFFLPLFYTAVQSFNLSDTPDRWGGFTLDWYIGSSSGLITERLGVLNDPEMVRWPTGGILVSVIVGLASTGISLLFGTMAAFAIVRYKFPGKNILNNFLYLGLVVPSIVMGMSLLIFIRVFNDLILAPVHMSWSTGLGSIILGHATFNIPLATIIILISLREFDRSLEEAAMNLGADEITTFFKVTLPIITPGIISAALLCFTFSFDELAVSLFLQGQSFKTLPVVIWGLLAKHFLSPEINAASTLILVLSVVFVLAANKVQKGGAIFRF